MVGLPVRRGPIEAGSRVDGSTEGVDRARAGAASACDGVSLRGAGRRAEGLAFAGDSGAESCSAAAGLVLAGGDELAREEAVRLGGIGSAPWGRSGLPDAAFTDSGAAGRSD